MKRNAFVKLNTVLMIAAMTLTLGCKSAEDRQDAPELFPPVTDAGDVAEVTKQDICNIKLYDGQVVPFTDELGFDAEGMIDEIKVELGEKVKKGQVLAMLNGAVDNARYESVKNEIEQTEKNNEEALVNSNYDIKIREKEASQLERRLKKASGEEKKQLKNELAIKRVEVEIEKKRLENNKEMWKIELDELKRQKVQIENEMQEYFLKAPADGVISCIAAKKGEQVGKGSFVIALSDENYKQIKAVFATKQEFEKADRCYVKYKNKDYDVTQLSYDADEIQEIIALQQTPYVYYELNDQNVDFETGDYVDVYIETGRAENALVVPVNAVFGSGEERYVYKKEGETKVKTAVTVGTVTQSFAQIVDGIKEGDEVYVK